MEASHPPDEGATNETVSRNAEQELQDRLEQLTAIGEAGIRLQQLHTSASLAQELFGVFERALEYEFGVVLLIDEVTGALVPFALSGRGRDPALVEQDKEHIVSQAPRLGKGITGWVAQTGQSARLGDVRSDPRYFAMRDNIRSELCVPMRLGDRVIGVVNIETTKADAYSEADQRLLETIARQIALAIHNASLYDETRRRLAELEAVSRISATMRVARTLDEMLSRLLDETLAVLNTDAGALWLYDTRRRQTRQSIAKGWFADVFPLPVSWQDGLAGQVLATGEAYLTRDIADDPYTQELTRALIPARVNGICVPLRAVQDLGGVFFVAAPPARQWGPSEVHLLTTLAEIASNAIHRMQLNEQTERHLQHIIALRDIDIAITASLDLNVILKVLLERTTAQLGVDAAAVLLLDREAQLLNYVAWRGFRGSSVQGVQLGLIDSRAGRAVRERHIIHDPQLWSPMAWHVDSQLLRAEGFADYYAVPLIRQGNVKGVLEVLHRNRLNPDAEWMDFLEAAAGQAAIAVDDTQLFESLQRSNLELAQAYDSTLEGWSRALDLRDKETEGHTQRVTTLTLQLAALMHIDDAQMVHVRRGALLHDIGKMGVPDSVLLKPGPLNEEEWVMMRKHPVYAHELLYPIAYLRPALDIPYCHHEKWDGTGYPRTLRGEDIPLAARIFSVVDVWDALCSDRPYRPGWAHERVRDYIKAQSGIHFDPGVAQIFLSMEL